MVLCADENGKVSFELIQKKWQSPTTCHYQIFDENQNPVDTHTSIMCINILQNIKAVAPKLSEEIAGQTMYL
jgi:hypothetical protein